MAPGKDRRGDHRRCCACRIRRNGPALPRRRLRTSGTAFDRGRLPRHIPVLPPRVPAIADRRRRRVGGGLAGSGRTSERGGASAVPHVRAINDDRGRIMVLMTHNTDFGDAYEREGDNHEYFERFSVPGYAFGINTLVYAMTH